MLKSLAYVVGDKVEHCRLDSTEIGEIVEVLSDRAPNRKYAVRFGDKIRAMAGNEIALVESP